MTYCSFISLIVLNDAASYAPPVVDNHKFTTIVSYSVHYLLTYLCLVSINVARIFTTGVHSIFTSKAEDFFRHRP